MTTETTEATVAAMGTEEREDLVLGTAGHIDHGKSSLVLALTGTDPDRLAEEKRRGLTIELGFAKLDLPGGKSLGVVDVPGHERFVRQMIQGATGVDMALICIAADDGVMPQTREHIAVLQLLGVHDAVVALTKIDLVDDEWLALAREEMARELSGTVFADAPLVEVSSRTGEGLEELRCVLAQTAGRVSRGRHRGALRLPVDRVFTIKGAGTVVTGTLWSGTATRGDVVEVLPSGTTATIRSIEVHGEPQEAVGAGHRVALNLTGLATADIHPGDFLAAPHTVAVADRFDAKLSYLGAAPRPKPLRSGARVRVAHGTREVTGRVLALNGAEEIPCREAVLVQIRLDEPLPVSWRDRFVIRSYSPITVIGGGVVLQAHPRRRSRPSPPELRLLEALDAGEEAAIARAALALEPFPAGAAELAQKTGLAEETVAAALTASPTVRTLEEKGHPALFIEEDTLQDHLHALEAALRDFHATHPTERTMTRDALHRQAVPRATPGQFHALLAVALDAGIVEVVDGQLSHPQAGAGAARAQEEAASLLYERLAEGGATPPTREELLEAAALDPALAHRALAALERDGRVVSVTENILMTKSALGAMERAVRGRLSEGPATTAELKAAMGTTRKFAIPLLEYFDGQGVTRREGDRRLLA